jgi:2'-5' RNA ligase
MSDEIRAFLALEIPESIKSELEAARRPLVEALPRARWVRPEGMHLTLKFLGESSPEVLRSTAADLARELGGLGSVTVGFDGAGFFPSRTRPRVAWLGGRAKGVEPIVAVVEGVSEAHGFSREPRPWALHLTQARLPRPWPPSAVERFLQWGSSLELDPFGCPEVVLFSSELRPGGVVYTALERMPLG